MKLIKVTIADDKVETRKVDIPNYCRFLKNNTKKESAFNDNGKRKANRGGNEN